MTASIWFHHDEHILPARPEPPQRDPEQPIVHLHRRPEPFPLEGSQLLPASENLQAEIGTRSEEDA